MDATVKQRILGVIVLVGLLGFCLTVLLRNTKTQPHIPKINTHPAFSQVETPNSVFAKPAATPTNTATKVTPTADMQNKTATQTITKPQQQDIIPAPVTVAPPPIMPATPVVAQPVLQAPQEVGAQNAASLQQPEVNLTGNSATASATSASVATPTTPITTPTTAPATTQTTATATTEKSHHKQQRHHRAVTAAHTHKKEISKSTATAGDQKNMMIQVGTFSLPANAATLVDKLHSKGFAAVSEKMKTSKGEMTRVIVGKKGLDHGQAEALRKDLEKSMKLNGIIISHAKD